MACKRTFLILFILQWLIKPFYSSFAHVKHIAQFYPEWKPNAIIDVGANRGSWSSTVRSIFPNAKMMLYEAFPGQNTTLKRVTEKIQNAQYKICVLSDKDGDTVQFYQQGKFNTGNSMFKEQTDFFKNIQPTERNTTTLDTEIQKSFLRDEPIDYLKLDVQGAELVILKGATQVLKEVTFVQMETGLIVYNLRGPCFYDIDSFMRQQGFYLYNLADFVQNAGLFKTLGPGQFDVLYVRPTSSRIPKYFTDKKPKYCGSDHPQETDKHSSNETNVTQPTLQNDIHGVKEVNVAQPTLKYIFNTYPLIFLIGFVLGRMTHIRKHRRR